MPCPAPATCIDTTCGDCNAQTLHETSTYRYELRLRIEARETLGDIAPDACMRTQW